MREVKLIGGLPFQTPSNRMEDYMKIGELIENLISIKRQYSIYYPDDNYINLACNVLEHLPSDMTVDEVKKMLESDI